MIPNDPENHESTDGMPHLIFITKLILISPINLRFIMANILKRFIPKEFTDKIVNSVGCLSFDFVF